MVPLSKVCVCQSKRKQFFLTLLITLVFITYKYQIGYDNIRARYLQFLKNVTMTSQCERVNYSERVKISSKGIWTMNSIGRLGNQMGEYATLYALAKLNGHQAYILPAMANYLSPIFKITLPTLHDSVRNRIHWKGYNLHDWMEDQYHSIPGDYVMLSGYLCSWTFYHHIREEILREFTFHDFLKEQTNAFLRRIRGERKNVTYVGVHVRRGDYVHVMPNVWKGVIADKKYLDTAMAYFRNKYKNAVFVVTSNGMDWSKENIDNSKGDVFFSDNPKQSSPADDITLLAHCNHTIMTIGTFGYWAGYLAGGETIYLTNFTLPESPFLKLFKYEAAFLPEWIGLPADLSPLLPKDASKLDQ
ncbi:galactoside alpha-(1,2)-fucosyltransferase 2-like [Scyliorhinus canicula]|uniref:galactoside alpha-(1,2)-fucosyltransferase 2-like n=1 Tax=Scyliorhinus canicula TaxID=7830 RepID=UPI0018F4B4D0|nr:galactoside alpha-(1,2)-fucosyltransferase 2-like [Scyliorhinus canicula]